MKKPASAMGAGEASVDEELFALIVIDLVGRNHTNGDADGNGVDRLSNGSAEDAGAEVTGADVSGDDVSGADVSGGSESTLFVSKYEQCAQSLRCSPSSDTLGFFDTYHSPRL